jgi:hypothetical protein
MSRREPMDANRVLYACSTGWRWCLTMGDELLASGKARTKRAASHAAHLARQRLTGAFSLTEFPTCSKD